MTDTDAGAQDAAGRAAAHNARALQAMRAGDAGRARSILDQAVVEHQDDVALWLNLAGACRAMGDAAAAFGAVEGALRIDPRSFLALLMKASLLERQGSVREAGVAYGIALTQAPDPQALDPATRRALEHARAVHADYQEGLRRQLLDAVADVGAPGRTVEGRRIATFIDHLVGSRRIFHQRPTSFFYPGLPSIEFYPREDFPWLEDIEAATEVIRRELYAVMADDSLADRFGPYVDYPPGLPLDQWAELNRSPRWSAFYLFRDGAVVSGNAERCPTTMAALDLAPQPRVIRRSPAAMFSVLQPKTRIPPHTGVSNTRLVVHLPLILPGGCRFRVGNETRVWRDGEAWVFDDTIEHEAWNDSDRPRTILIFDIWSPFLSEAERELIAQVTAAADAFNGAPPEQGL
ncbi:MAG TPA: aspartyl/asparaginyl beta-hydroxylase domain-containing protein [Caulobacteraceae bacterium]|nr:aspartyl/asparaginyl beta-hydroxylase domain-containing protein [Caulobacteraceae bacterium]